MKVLFLVTRFHTNLIPWVEALLQEGCPVRMLCKKKGATEDYSTITPEIIEPENFDAEKAQSVVDSFCPDLVILNDKSECFKALAKIAERQGAKAVLYEQRDYYRKPGPRGVMKDLKRISRRVRGGLPLLAITPSVGDPNGAQRHFAKHFHVPMRPRIELKEREYIKAGAPRIICVGKVAHQVKRHVWVIDALEELQFDCELLIVGAGDDRMENPDKRDPGYYDEVHRRAQANTVSGGVRILEDLSHDEVMNLYSDCDIMVLPSEREAFGISPVEAMASGCAVVATDASGSTGYITHGYDGLHFAAGEYDDLLLQLRRLLLNHSEIERLGRNALKTIVGKHSYSGFTAFLRGFVG